MTIMIEEVQMEVTGASPPEGAASSPRETKQKLDLRGALERVRERQARLKAD